jgi:hypothetical protein
MRLRLSGDLDDICHAVANVIIRRIQEYTPSAKKLFVMAIPAHHSFIQVRILARPLSPSHQG